MKPENKNDKNILLMTLACLGVVYGDLGTSPLYAIRECFHGSHGIPLNAENLMGILSLIFWTITLIVCIKYLYFVIRADNNGEGGVLALMTLAHPSRESLNQGKKTFLLFSGLFGAALLYGDSIITPAISVLSAVEGLGIATHAFEPFIIPLTLAILLLLFLPQKYGTEKVGRVFGPVIITWFTTLGLLGIRGILMKPDIVQAVNPIWAVYFFQHHSWESFWILGSVFLCVTGAEALYADMGHFGKKPIRYGWFYVAFPGLILNYFGQGALLLTDPSTVDAPFYKLAPDWALYPLIVITTLATITASQAVISGAYSLTNQAIQLGFLPRMVIKYTSREEMGQIYVPQVNWMLLIATVWLVVTFGSSSRLAAAYGFAVSTAMVITTLLMFIAARKIWSWSIWKCAIFVPFLIIDVVYFSANCLKIEQGGWFPLLIGLAIVTVMTTWRKGRIILGTRIRENSSTLEEYVHELEKNPPITIPGTAVFMVGSTTLAPPALVHNVKHNQVLHERVIIIAVRTANVPRVSLEDRLAIEKLSNRFVRIVISYGFIDHPNIPLALRLAKQFGVDIDLKSVTYYLGRETLIATERPGMAVWRERMFAILSRNSQRATEFFKIPPKQVIEIGMQVEL